MATKKAPSSRSKPQSKTSPGRLQNLAAPPTFDEPLDEQLVDHSGVFRVTSQLERSSGREDRPIAARYASDSLVMAAQRDPVMDDGPTLDESLEDPIEAEATAAMKRQRLAALAARNQARTRSRR
jgi:hypothetical protein